MAKAFSSMADLEARIMNRLQEQKRGQTIEQIGGVPQRTASQDPLCTHAAQS
jgi:hypothetical protein